MSVEVNCLCGEVKLSLKGEPIHQLYCHCDDCQAVHGAAYIGAAIYDSDDVEILQGETETWVYKTNPRTRCATCGTILFVEPPNTPWKGVKANLLPKTSFNPKFHIFCEYAELPVVDSLPHYKGLPAAFGGSDDTVDW